jgi:ATP-dependent DNA helicase DinG
MSQPIEVTAHITLRNLLRHQPAIADWNHHLTMARLVGRGLRMSKSALIQVGVPTQRLVGKYRIGYLIPALLCQDPVIVTIPTACQSHLVTQELPLLQQWLKTNKPVYCGTELPPAGFKGLWVIDTRSWLDLQLADRLVGQFWPTIIDGAEDLEEWTQSLLTVRLTPDDWDNLRSCQTPATWEKISDLRIQLLQNLWQRPVNPYNCYLLEPQDRSLIESLFQLCSDSAPNNWQGFYRQLATPTNRLLWATIDRTHGKFTLAIAPNNVAEELAAIWERQPAVLITSSVDLNATATGYRQQLGLDEITSVKFSLDRQTDICQLYIPRWMPMPNTPKFQPILTDEIQHLLHLVRDRSKFIIILVGDTPLQAQLASILAAEWGRRVQVEQIDLDESNILISGWEFWQQHQDDLPIPKLAIVATLPIPSLENPLVAAKVNFYKQQRQDWFRLYLLPTGLRILHRAIAPIRESQGVVAIFDNRINQRSYGKQVITALSPAARIDYPDLSWLE